MEGSVARAFGAGTRWISRGAVPGSVPGDSVSMVAG
jgi:hypothetical protein